jgi:hypothetical protein
MKAFLWSDMFQCTNTYLSSKKKLTSDNNQEENVSFLSITFFFFQNLKNEKAFFKEKETIHSKIPKYRKKQVSSKQ